MITILRVLTALCMVLFFACAWPVSQQIIYGGDRFLLPEAVTGATAFLVAILLACASEIVRLLRKIAGE